MAAHLDLSLYSPLGSSGTMVSRPSWFHTMTTLCKSVTRDEKGQTQVGAIPGILS